jgi:hypothetical protein
MRKYILIITLTIVALFGIGAGTFFILSAINGNPAESSNAQNTVDAPGSIQTAEGTYLTALEALNSGDLDAAEENLTEAKKMYTSLDDEEMLQQIDGDFALLEDLRKSQTNADPSDLSATN